MHEIGLIPTDTGREGGKETGQKVSHLIEANGRFAVAVQKFLVVHPTFLYYDQAGESNTTRTKKRASKTKYTCPVCGLNAWAKPDALLLCGECHESMLAENSERDEDE